MTATSAALAGRRAAEALMTSTCTITRPGEGKTWDDETGTYVPGAAVVVYAGKCRVRPATTWGRETAAGEAEVMLSSFFVHLPFGVVGVEVGQTLTIDSSPDPALTGRKLIVRFVPDMGDFITARRLVCEAA